MSVFSSVRHLNRATGAGASRLERVLRRRWLIAASVAVGVLALGLLGFPALVRWQVERAAAAAGFRVAVDDVELGVGRVWVSQVEFQSQRLAGLGGRLGVVEVRLGLGGVAGVTVHGGAVRVTASRADLARSFGKREGGGGSDRGERGFELDGRGIFLEWVSGEQERISLWGVRFARDPGGHVVSFDAARLQHPALEVELEHARVTLDRALQVREVVSAKTLATVDFERLVADADAADERPGDKTTPPGGADPASLSGPLDLLLRLDESRGKKLRARVSQFSGVVARRLPEGSALDLSGVVLRLGRGDEGLSLGPARVRVAREPSNVFFSFEPTLEAEAQQRFALTARLPLADGESEVALRGGPVRLASLGIREGDLGLQGLEDAQVEVKAEMRLNEDGSRLSASSSGRVENLSLSNPRLGSQPLSGIDVGWDARGSLATDGSALTIDSGEVSLGEVRVNVELELERGPQAFALNSRVEIPLGSCSDMLASLPKNLVPFADQIRLSGTFSWRMALAVDSERLADMDLDWRMQNDCRFERVSEELSPERFRAPFVRQIPDAEGLPLGVIAGPGTESWVPIADVSRFLEAAVLVSEDGRFWSHRGFDQRAIESSIRQNVQAGRFMRGASTISMQLAKNLYLTREKTVTRKIQEALFTMLLEQTLRKDEILELYFNVVELGPGVYGIGPGAEYYFRSLPSDLSVAQSFFLASVLPSPGAQRFDEAGNLAPHWRRYVDRLMRIAAERGRITEDDLARGLSEEVRFGVPAIDPWDSRESDGLEPERGETVPE